MVERIEINLLPAEYRVRKTSVRLQREIVYPLLILAVITFGLWTWTMSRMAQVAILNSDITSLEKTIAANKHIQIEIDRLKNEKQLTQEKIRALNRINVNREKWVRLLEVLCGSLPDFSWLRTVEEKEAIPALDGKPAVPPTLEIEGRTFSFPDVANYMSRLGESEFVSGVDLTNIEQTTEVDQSYLFKIVCKVNPDAKLGAVEDSASVKSGPASVSATKAGSK